VAGHAEEHDGAAVSVCVSPVLIEGILGVIATELRVTGGAETVMIVPGLIWVMPSRVTFTSRPTDPSVDDAVKVTEADVVELSVPRPLLVSAHEYFAPLGQLATPAQVRVVLKTCVRVGYTVAVAGLTATDVRVVADVMVMDTAALSNVTEFSVTLTNNATFPGVVPAVNSTGLPVVTFKLPMALSLRFQRYVAPVGQAPPVHSMEARNDWVPPIPMVAVVGATAIVLIGGLAVTVIGIGAAPRVSP
jgi:hypothetical protein